MDHHLIGKLPFAESATLYPLEPCVPAVLPPPIPNRRKMKVLINLVGGDEPETFAGWFVTTDW